MTTPIILASKSPRRKYLLELAEIPFSIETADTEESYPDSMPISEVPLHIARGKAEAVKKKFPTSSILAADTIVVLNNKIIGKPKDKAEAIETLKQLSGNTHQVLTGVIFFSPGGTKTLTDITSVSFYPLDDEQIHYYVNTYEPYDKAGAYAIQEWIGAVAIRSIEGCFYNVMGLPISKLIPWFR